MKNMETAIVIGGGIAGPVAALALRKAGIDARVYEAYPQPTEGIGGALALEPNGLAALAVIGAADAVRSVATPITRSVLTLGEKTLGEIPRLPGLPPRHVVERADLHRILTERAREAGVDFVHGKRLVGADEHGRGIVARFEDGTTASADVLIGADGVRSIVRTLIDSGAPAASFTGLLGFGGTVDAGLDLEPGSMTFAFGRRAYYLYWPTRDGRTAWGANLPAPKPLSLTEARAVPAQQWLDTLRATYSDDSPGARLVRCTTPETLQVVGALHIMPPIPHWHRGRMVLVGDAVHAPSNSTGQGASLAIESAVQLARCLRDLPDLESAFRAYEALRRPRVESIARRGAKINHSKAPGRVARMFMPLALPLMFKMMDLEKTMGAEQRYVIDWESRVASCEVSSASAA
jgi:2-polyprenyl-6-methoxyphenol hydroxylase-like FAD-dependent oxidoreductase